MSDIDRICTHVGVIDDGKVVFSGSIKEMKKNTRSSFLRLELDGDLNLFSEALKNLEGVVEISRRGDFALDLGLDTNHKLSDVLGDVVGLIKRFNLDLISVTSSSSSIEDAFLEILKVEESRGFLRAV